MALYDSFSLVDKMEKKINVIHGLKQEILTTKLNNIFFKNKHLKTFRKNKALLGEGDQLVDINNVFSKYKIKYLVDI